MCGYVESSLVFVKGHDEMKTREGHLYRLDSSQSLKVKALVKRECCNFDGGGCALLERSCPQMCSESITCTWFRKAVLPMDQILERSIFSDVDYKKKCSVCGKAFIPKTNSSKYCDKCAKTKIKENKLEAQRKRRSLKPF